MTHTVPIRVVSLNAWGIAPDPGDLVIRVDRRINSPLANPILLERRRCPAERDRVIDHYQALLATDIEHNGPMSVEIDRIASEAMAFAEIPGNSGNYVALACWCAPLRCHAEVVRRAVLDRIAAHRESPRDQTTHARRQKA